MTPTLSGLVAEDVPTLARLHRRAFPSFFLSRLGEAFLTEFYSGFLDDPTAVAVVARDGLAGEPTGVVVGTLEPDRFFSRLLRRRWRGFVLAAAGTVLRRPRMAPRLLAAVAYRGGTPYGGRGALLSSICVDPAAQGTGVGRRLVDAWLTEVAARGSSAAYLTTDADHNEPTNAFYRNGGWRVLGTYTTRGRRMNHYRIELPGGPAC